MKSYKVKPIVDAGKPVEGEGLVVEKPISFLGDVDPDTGVLRMPDSKMRGSPLKGRILFAPYGRGSTVGSYIMYALRRNGVNPHAIVMHKAEPIIITGAVISGIALYEGMPLEFYSKPRYLIRVLINSDKVEVYE